MGSIRSLAVSPPVNVKTDFPFHHKKWQQLSVIIQIGESKLEGARHICILAIEHVSMLVILNIYFQLLAI